MVSPDRGQDHLDAILALLDDEPARRRASEAGTSRARQFTWERTTDMLVQAFAALL